jgi:hypothetical protein
MEFDASLIRFEPGDLSRQGRNLSCGDAAIEDQLGTRHVRGSVRAQEQNAVGNVLRGAGAPDRHH